MAHVSQRASVFNPFLVVVKRAVSLHSTLFYAVSPIGDGAKKRDYGKGFWRENALVRVWRRGAEDFEGEERGDWEGRKGEARVKFEERFWGKVGREGEFGGECELGHFWWEGELGLGFVEGGKKMKRTCQKHGIETERVVSECQRAVGLVKFVGNGCL